MSNTTWGSNDFDRAARDVLAVLPARAHDMARLRVLAREGTWPVVTVIGKYNHGKSRLLNELIGSEKFAVADKRETVALAEYMHEDVRWLDAPGLDADVNEADDGHAHEAAWMRSDIRLFVHAAKEGELDANEKALLHRLRADGRRTRRQTLFVLTQVDQLADDAHLDKVIDAIEVQAPGIALHPVSSTRHRRGLEAGKQLLLEKSGVPALQALLRSALVCVPQARAHEAALLLGEIRTALQELQAARLGQLSELMSLQQHQREDFEQGLAAVLDKVQGDLQPVLDVAGIDQALVPDSFENMFRLTAGKQERARIQIAYSRACIEINGHLVRHGVVGLPPAQQTAVRSLDTVMVAVMGVFVKYRDDLRRIFCEQTGQAELQRQFAHYFDLSPDRVALVQQVTQAQADAAAAGKALDALAMLERV